MSKRCLSSGQFGRLAALVLLAGKLTAADYYLRTGTTHLTLPNGSNVVMWGFAHDSAFGAMDGFVTVPGPTLNVLPGDPTLRIHLDNRLPEPVSLVIAGQRIDPEPVRMPNGRARSFTTETPSANSAPVVYTWSNLRPGTFIYQSGTHPSVQVQMGLYGAVRKDAAPGQTYPGVPFNSEATLLYSEVDPALHDAVAAGNYGPGNAMPSTVGYEPKYFLINGQFYTSGLLPIYAGKPGDTIVLHFLNAGLRTHVPIVNGTYLRLIAEDGFPYPYPKEQYTACLPAGKTLDALFTPGNTDMLAVYDRRLNMMNGASSPGGMLAYLNVAASSHLTEVPADWVVTYFGPGPIYPPNTVGPMDDPDGDGVSNLNEYISGTGPNNPQSFLRITALSPPDPLAGTVLTYGDTVAGRSYNVQSSTNLVTGPWTTIIANVPGSPNVMTFTDTRPAAATSFYRIQIAYP